MGKYTLWQPGRAFCDRFELQMKQAFVPARGYHVAVSLFDPQTTAPLPENSGNGPFVGWVASPGPMLTPAERDSARFDFDGINCWIMRWTTADGITLNLHWGTGDWQPRPVTLFVHVLNANGDLVGPPDAPLGGDVYPAFLWGQNERTYDQTLDVPLAPGDYTVYACTTRRREHASPPSIRRVGLCPITAPCWGPRRSNNRRLLVGHPSRPITPTGCKMASKTVIKETNPMRIVWVLYLFLLLAVTVRAQDSPPIVYYYDPYAMAWSWNAPGTEARLLGVGVIPQTSYIAPGWSPHGKWFAGASIEGSLHQGYADYLPWAVSADGKRRVTAIDDYRTARLWWSPVDDLLFAMGPTGDPFVDPNTGSDTGFLVVRLAIIDPEQDAVLVSVDIGQPASYYDGNDYLYQPGSPAMPILWTADGRYVIAAHYDISAPQGQIVYEILDAQTRTASAHAVPAAVQALGVSPAGALVYSLADKPGLVLESLTTGETLRFQESALADLGGDSLIWNSDGDYALIERNGVWLLDVRGRALKRIAPDVGWHYDVSL
jgi:hypothetical protein